MAVAYLSSDTLTGIRTPLCWTPLSDAAEQLDFPTVRGTIRSDSHCDGVEASYTHRPEVVASALWRIPAASTAPCC